MNVIAKTEVRKAASTRLLLRLAKDLKLLSLDAYTFAAERLDEIGRMVGGWRKVAVTRYLPTQFGMGQLG